MSYACVHCALVYLFNQYNHALSLHIVVYNNNNVSLCSVLNDGIVCVQSNNNHAVVIHWLKGSYWVKVNEWRKKNDEKKKHGKNLKKLLNNIITFVKPMYWELGSNYEQIKQKNFQTTGGRYDLNLKEIIIFEWTNLVCRDFRLEIEMLAFEPNDRIIFGAN